MNVLIVGATGNVGQLTVEKALAAGHQVTGFARSPEKLGDRGDRLRQVSGNVMDAASVDTAIPGHDAVITVFGAPLKWSTLTQVPDLCTVGTRNIIQAMQRHNVRRLICMSGIGAGNSRGHGRFLFNNVLLPLLLDRIYTDKNRQEQAVMESGLDWTIVRPTELTDKPGTGSYQVWTDLDGKTAQTIPRSDVADFLVKQVDSDQYWHQIPLITQ